MATGEPYERLIQRLSTIGKLAEAEEAALRTLPLRVRGYERGEDVIRQGDKPTESCLIIRGLVCRYKMVGGGKRQILSLHFAGDMPDLQGLHLEVMDHGISCMTSARAAFIPHQAIKDVIRSQSGLADLFMKHTLIDASIFRD